MGQWRSEELGTKLPSCRPGTAAGVAGSHTEGCRAGTRREGMLPCRNCAPGDSATCLSYTYPSATMHGQEGAGDRGFLLSQQAHMVRVQWWHGDHSHPSCQDSLSSPLQPTSRPAAHWPCSAPSILGDGFSQGQSITWLSAPLGSVYTSSSNYHLFKHCRKTKLLYKEGNIPSL